MTLDSDACYRALAAHDTRFDGRFYVGVASTGIYCRPICNVRMPRRENCRFFPSAAAAEVAGYRPCLRCRPELAPGHASVDASARLARGAVNLIENGVMDEGGIETLAARVGVTSRHLRRIFETEYGVSPVEYAQTQRLLLAKRLLTDTALPVTEVALASGFASVRRFNDLFRTRYRMAPSRLRKERAGGTLPASLVFLLAYRAPYDWSAIHDFLARRAVAGIESVTEGGYARTVSIRHRGTAHAGRIDVRHLPRKSALEVSVAATLAPVVPALLSRVKQAFDLACDPVPVALALGPLAARHPGLRVPGTFDGFELAVRAIVGQQVSVRGARTVLGRLVSAFGTPLLPAEGALTHLFPVPAALAAAPVAELARIGLTGARARAIIALAQAMANGALVLEPEADVDATVARLLGLPGVGAWTAQYVAMRALRWPDAFPAGDLVVRRMLGAPRPAQALEKARQWQPWRAYAVMHLWRTAQ
jgi:AraC family transcriptional regulator of adaptative response / DNA-3-methyladenine glycosylase II